MMSFRPRRSRTSACFAPDSSHSSHFPGRRVPRQPGKNSRMVAAPTPRRTRPGAHGRREPRLASIRRRSLHGRQRRREETSRSCLSPETGEVWLKTIEDEPVTLGEVPVARAVEEERRLGVPQGGGDRDIQFVRDLQGTEPDVVQPCLVQLSERCRSPRASVRACLPAGVGGTPGAPPSRSPRRASQFHHSRPRPRLLVDRHGGGSASNAVPLAVRHPIGLDELSELDEQLPREGLVVAESFRFGHEVQQALGVGSGEVRHGLQKIRRMTNGLQRAAVRVLCKPRGGAATCSD